MGDQSENMNPVATATSSLRRSSFMILCQQERRRSIPVPGRLPVTLKAPKASGGCTSRILSSTQAAGTTAALAVGESGSLDTEDDHSAIATGGDGMSDEVVALHELISTQKGDLETAALIGQRLLDATDELSAKLEAAREEKWLVECEKEALRRDLEHATQRCEQMQRDTRIEIVPGEETLIEEFDLWSPVTAVTGAARMSSLLSTTAFASAASDNSREKEKHEADGEIDRLKKEFNHLEQANNALKEKLIEARLETTALRHTSVEHGEAALDTETDEVGDEDKQGLRCANWSAADARGTLWVREGDEAGVYQDDGGEEAIIRSPGIVSGGTDTQEPAAPVVYDAYNPTKLSFLLRTKDNSDGVERTGETPEVVTPPASLLRRLSSSAFKDEEEQRELIEALRDQISQLQLEQQMAMAHTAAAKADSTWGGKSALRSCDGDAEKRRSCSNCSSDDDSGSGGDDGQGNPLRENQPRSWCPNHVVGDAFSEEEASRRRKESGGDIHTGAISNPAHSLLQARIHELSAELDAANKEIEALREQAQQNQAESLELQRELLRLQGTRDKRSLIAAAVAAHSIYHDPSSDGGESLEQRSNCLNYHGLGWLHWVWVTVFGGEGRAGEGVGSRIEDSVHDDTPMDVGGELGDGIDRRRRSWDSRGGRISADERDFLLNRDKRTTA